MIVDKYGRVAGSIDLATLAQMYGQSDDDDLRAHYRQVAAENGLDLDADESPEPESEPAAVMAGEGPMRPVVADNKATWVDWAVSQGADREDAEAATKAELVELYGTKGVTDGDD